MGLSISTGTLSFLRSEDPDGCESFRRQLDEVNRLLRSNGLPEHHEPAILPRLQSRFTHIGQPYSWLHYLRRAVAHAMEGCTQLEPLGAEEDPIADPLYDSVLFSFASHLVCHSDCEGFYVPVDFLEPLYDDLPSGDEHCILGGILGSSQGAMRELIHVAPLLDIPVEKGKLSDQQFARIENECTERSPFWIERLVWLKFFEQARLSIEYRTAISFG